MEKSKKVNISEKAGTYFGFPVGRCHGLLGLAVDLEAEGRRFFGEGPSLGLQLEPDLVGRLVLGEGQLGVFHLGGKRKEN